MPNINFQGYTFARFREPQFFLRAALSGYLLTVQFQRAIEVARPEAPHWLLDHSLVIRVNTDDGDKYVGRARPTSMEWLRRRDHAYDETTQYVLSLTTEQLASIEIVRSRRPLRFLVGIEATGLNMQNHQTFASSLSVDTIEVQNEAWIKQLADCGFANKTIYEFDLPLSPLNAVEGSSFWFLKEAHAAFLSNQLEHCAMQCRKALEALTKTRGDKDQLQELGPNAPARERLTAAERVHILRRELFRIASVGPHTNDAVDFDDFRLTRAEASLLLAATAGVLAATDSRVPVSN